jgi:hypothetical protein
VGSQTLASSDSSGACASDVSIVVVAWGMKLAWTCGRSLCKGRQVRNTGRRVFEVALQAFLLFSSCKEKKKLALSFQETKPGCAATGSGEDSPVRPLS